MPSNAARPGSLSETGPGPTAADTRERILDVAEALFTERGLAGTSVRDIAARAGLTPASLYNHFAGKEALYEAVLERGVRPLLALMQELAAREPTPDATEEILGAVMEHLARRPHVPRLIHHEAVTGGEHLAGLARGWIRPLLEQGIAQMEREPSPHWERDEYPLVIAAWLHLIFGHFGLAPLLSEVLPEDPLSPAGVERQTRFLRKLARLMMEVPPAESGDAGGTAWAGKRAAHRLPARSEAQPNGGRSPSASDERARGPARSGKRAAHGLPARSEAQPNGGRSPSASDERARGPARSGKRAGRTWPRNRALQ